MSEIAFRYDVRPGDDEVVREIVNSTGFFYDFEIPVAVELIEDRLKNGDNSYYCFIFAMAGSRTIAYSCYGHIAGTERSYDLYWIVTHNDFRGKGIGKLLLEETQRIIRSLGGKNLVAETSSLEKYQPTRRFYEKMGYEIKGLVPDYYKEGDAKVTFVKRL